MRIATMKAIDHHAGRALAGMLEPLAGVKPGAMPVAGDPSVRTIALVKFWGMGSIVLMTPAIQLLRARYPAARLVFVTQAANREVVGLLEGIDVVETLEVGKGPATFALSLAHLIVALRRRRVDLWLDCEFLTRFSALLTAVCGATTRVGFTDPVVDRGDFHHVRLPFNGHWHMIDNFCLLATGDIQPAAFPRPLQRIGARPPAVVSLAAKLEAAGLAPGEPYLVLNPNAGELALERRWSVERFAQLADALAPHFAGKLVLVGAPSERAYVARVTAAITLPGRVIDLSGQTSLDELVALFAGAALMVSNDTGPLHLACAVGTPTVAIFGPETPGLFGPRGPQHRVIYKGLACSPCLNIYNGRSVNCRFATTHCVADITVEEVLAAACQALTDQQSAPAVI